LNIVELGVVIGQGGREIKADKAMDHIAGYCLAIDYTGRNMQDAAKAKGLPWSAAKVSYRISLRRGVELILCREISQGFDTSCPVGEFIPKDKVEDPHKLKLWYKVCSASIRYTSELCKLTDSFLALTDQW